MSNIFITGGTGFLGAIMISELLTSSKDTLHLLARGESREEARTRIYSALAEVLDGDTLKEYDNNIRVYNGDITKKDLGLEKEVIKELSGTVDEVYNCAANTDLTQTIDKARKVNVMGTKNVLDFSVSCQQSGTLKKVNHISTAYIVGTKRCCFKESDLDVGQDFNNTYEQSKYEAEKLVREYRDGGLDVDVFRPGIIVGRYSDGKTTNFKMFYQPLRFFALEYYRKVPAAYESRVNLINVDVVARAIVGISRSSNIPNRTFHIASPSTISLGKILDEAERFFGYTNPEFINLEEFDISKEYSFVNRKMIEPFIPYLNYFAEFDMKETLNVQKRSGFSLPEFEEENLKRLLEYCDSSGFIRKKGKDAVKE